MRHRIKPPVEPPGEDNPAAAALDKLVGDPKTKPKRSRKKTRQQLDQEIARVEERLRDDDWDDLRPGDVVAAHAFCHHRLYGEHDDLTGEAWSRACLAAHHLVRNEFGGDFNAALVFIRWAWTRERKREERRKRNGTDGEGKRLTWRLLISWRHILTDYRVESRRSEG